MKSNERKYIISALLIVLGLLFILLINNNPAPSYDDLYESMYIGSEGYRVYEFERHGNCYELLTRGNNSFAIKIECEGKGE